MPARSKPIIYVASANPDRKSAFALPALLEEEAKIRESLRNAIDEDGSWEYDANLKCNHESLVQRFYSNRVAVFHYGGHADPKNLFLPADSDGNQFASEERLEAFLARQETLQLAFFNACSTRAWAEYLIRDGVPCVIATACAVPDKKARDFAAAFYENLASDQTIASAFDKAKAAVNSIDEHGAAVPAQSAVAAESAKRTVDEAEETAPQTNEFQWALYTRDASAAEWKLSIGANDPLIGLPPLDLQKYPLPETPYVSIKGHQVGDAAIFFGRNREIRELYDWMLRNPDAPPLMLFYGQSGAGKSSLLNAGLLPRLDGQVDYVCLRRNANLIDDLHRAIGGESNDAARAWLASDKPKLIILDQVEEAITHSSGSTKEIGEFIDRLAEIFSLRQPGSKARLILSFRKEYLAEIRNALVEKIPEGASPLIQDFWLERLDFEAVKEVVTGPVRSSALRKKYKISFLKGEDLPTIVASDLEDRSSSVATVLEIILNQLLKAANEEAKQEGGDPVYSRDLYKGLSLLKNPLEGFYKDRISQLDSKEGGTANDEGLELDLLFEHTTPFATSKRRTLADLLKLYPKVKVPDLEQLIRRNKELYLLTEPAQEQAGSDGAASDGSATSLAHDTLAPVIRREFELSVLRGSRARRLLENRAREWTNGKPGDTFDAADLKTVEDGLNQMRSLETPEFNLLQASRERRRRERRRLIVWSSAATAIVAVLFALTFRYFFEVIQVRQVMTRSTGSVDRHSEMVGLLESMQAASDLTQSRFLALIPNQGLKGGVRANLQEALNRTKEVGRYPFNQLALAAGPCAVAFDDQDRLRFESVGDSGGTFDGKAMPADFYSTNDLATTCDPVSGRIAAVRSANQILTWKDGVSSIVDISRLGDDFGRYVTALAMTPAGDKIAAVSTSGAIEILDVNSNAQQAIPRSGTVYSMAFGGDGSLLGTAGDQGWAIWNLAGGRTVKQAGNPGVSTRIQFGGSSTAPVAAILVTGPQSCGVAVGNWDYLYSCTENGTPSAIAVNRDGTLVAVGRTDGKVDVWPYPKSGLKPLLSDMPASPSRIVALAFSPDSKLLATSSWKSETLDPDLASTVRVWQLDFKNETKYSEKDNLNVLLAAACARTQIYLDQMGNAPNPLPNDQVDIGSIRTACSTAHVAKAAQTGASAAKPVATTSTAPVSASPALDKSGSNPSQSNPSQSSPGDDRAPANPDQPDRRRAKQKR
ncbi:MAG: CHAT domain-containing protein [Terracidiphilus sp.]